MSIATDEALEWHGLHGDDPGARDPTYSAEELDAAYIAGRTAEPTTVEVSEAAYALWKTEVNMADLNPTETEYTDAWGKLSRQQRDMYRSKARTVLEAARKAVME